MSKLRELAESLVTKALTKSTITESSGPLPIEISGVGDRQSPIPGTRGYNLKVNKPDVYDSPKEYLAGMSFETKPKQAFRNQVSTLKGPIHVYDSERDSLSDRLDTHARNVLTTHHAHDNVAEVHSGHIEGHPAVRFSGSTFGTVVHGSK